MLVSENDFIARCEKKLTSTKQLKYLEIEHELHATYEWPPPISQSTNSLADLLRMESQSVPLIEPDTDIDTPKVKKGRRRHRTRSRNDSTTSATESIGFESPCHSVSDNPTMDLNIPPPIVHASPDFHGYAAAEMPTMPEAPVEQDDPVCSPGSGDKPGTKDTVTLPNIHIDASVLWQLSSGMFLNCLLTLSKNHVTLMLARIPTHNLGCWQWNIWVIYLNVLIVYRHLLFHCGLMKTLLVFLIVDHLGSWHLI